MAEMSGETRSTPAGIVALNDACRGLYPDQSNPRQVNTLVKYWLGGPDPLDYISIYWNPGNEDTPPHWHYVSYGMSDLHGDGRLHDAKNEKSGFGFELTFRLTSSKTDQAPTWPAELLQSIARYVFSTESVLYVGDHISWHNALDGGDSNIQHILLAEDPQLKSITTPHGPLTFIQLIGVTADELKAAQWWNCLGLLSLLAKHKTTGGSLLLTDMRRVETVFTIDQSNQSCVDEGVARDGSLLSGVNVVSSWDDGQGCHSDQELSAPRQLDKVKVHLSREAVKLLPLAISGRLRHGRHFTFKSYTEEHAVTMVTRGVEGAFTTEHAPLAAHGHWLQVYLTEQTIKELETQSPKLLAKDTVSIELSGLHLTLAVTGEQ